MSNAGRTILLVEPDADLRAVLSTFLSARRCRVVECAQSQDAQAILQMEAPALVLVGVRAQEGDALGLLATLRLRQPTLPIFCITHGGTLAEHVRDRLFSLQVDHVLGAPVHLEGLGELVDLTLGPPPPPAAFEETTARLPRPGDGGDGIGILPDPLVGTRVGSFKIIRRLGAGGMGVVYLGEHPLIGKKVAIKFLNERTASDSEAVLRFFAEARVAAMIGHQNIVDVLDLNLLPPNRYYIVMEYLDGQTLKARIRSGPTPPVEALPILMQLCDALHTAHERGVIHRDIKPDNVFVLTRDGAAPVVKLVDFGIAKLRERNAMEITEPGLVMGTPRYMSPEQRRGEAVDARSDVYSLGVLAAELLAGRPVMEGEPGEERLVFPDVIAPPVVEVLRRGMDPDPAARFGSVAEFKRALLAALGEDPTRSGERAAA